MKALIDTGSDRILGFSIFGTEAGEVMATVQVAMIAGLFHTVLRETIFTQPTLPEGLIALFENVPSWGEQLAARGPTTHSSLEQNTTAVFDDEYRVGIFHDEQDPIDKEQLPLAGGVRQ